MHFFLTAESTIDVPQSEFNIILEFEETLKTIHADVIIDGIESIGIVYVIMNPKFVAPFPPGIIFRKSTRVLDIKPQIDFQAWKANSKAGKIALLSQSAIDMVSLSRNLGEDRKSTIIELLQKGCSALNSARE
jgi:hypothetical protein